MECLYVPGSRANVIARAVYKQVSSQVERGKTIIPLALMASESIAHLAAIDSQPSRTRGIIVKYFV